jgi:hypothetical protein
MIQDLDKYINKKFKSVFRLVKYWYKVWKMLF